jgi:hypothetical protein
MQKRGAGEFEATDSASEKTRALYRLLVKDQLIQPLARDQENDRFEIQIMGVINSSRGAATFGLRPVWVNRFGAPPERLPGAAEHELRDLAGLPALLGL